MTQSANTPSSDSSLLVTAMIFNPNFFAAFALLNVFLLFQNQKLQDIFDLFAMPV